MRAFADATRPTAATTDFTSLWRRFHRPLAYFVSAQLADGSGDPAVQVDDAVQEIMVKLYRARDRYDARRPLAAWVYSIARNHCVDLKRRWRSRDQYAAELPEPELVPNDNDPEHHLLTQELFAAIDGFVESLEPDDRVILLLRYYEELPYAEIACATGRPEGTVRYRIHEIKKRLRTYMEARS
ncbi:MAG: RNA polymerase sigma factor [Spirochaetota bacterium]